jgi:oligopeptide/dipeptide ABC transporter ATP-binding protein
MPQDERREDRLRDILTVENLHKRFPLKRGGSVCAVNGITFSIREGETLGLVGESGCGKTTTGRCIVRLIEPTEGKIVFDGDDITRMPESDFRNLRSEIQIVFQEPYDALNPRKKVKQILEDPLIVNGKLSKGQCLEKVKEVLEMVELTDDRLSKYPIQLTQGEQQRIGVARALITNPKIVVLDEPTSLLDIRFRAEIVILLKKLQEKLGISYLFITHDLVVISELSHRVAIMYLGRIVEEGPARAVFKSPFHPYTRALLAAALIPDPDQKGGTFVLKGEVPSPVNLPDNRCNLAPRCPLVQGHCHESLPQLRELEEGHFVACFQAARP